MELVQNVINRKSLEKQLKLVQTRIETLETELSELDKIRQACIVLMGSEPSGEVAASEPTPKKEAKHKADNEEDKATAMPEIDAAGSEEAPALSN